MDLSSIKTAVSSFPPWMLLGAGFVGGYIKNFWVFIYDHTVGWLSNKCKVELVIEEQDHLEAFVWVNMWMEKHLSKRRVAKLRLQKKTNRTDKEREEKAFELLPSYGFYWMWWNRKLLTFYSEKKDTSGGGADYDNKRLIRTITLEIWGTRDRKLLMDVILEAKKEFDDKYPRSMKYYVHSSDYWESYSMDQRNLDTVYLPETLVKDALFTFELFFKSEKKYKSLGIPWRMGFLFEGPPGTGKSSLVKALSSYFQVPIYYLNANILSASGAMNLLKDAQGPCIILIEDVDSLKAAKVRKKEKGAKDKPDDESLGLKPSELLNLLDGLIATEQRIVIMTTNHPEDLDPALLRAGRVDRRFLLDYSTEEELKKFYWRAKDFYELPEYSVFRKSLSEKCTIADAQTAVFKYQTNGN